jgi:thymidylate synthase (FAD)|tara:strand:- start:937 stop:1581 length:645 start_codon:yes stop_codon:yes gene_type:complete
LKVQLIDSLGSDVNVVNAARVSFAKEVSEFSDRDEKLINYLASHDHWTPFSQVQYQVRISAPIFVARQWYKHQIGISRNEVSRRYVDYTPEVYANRLWRKRPENKKQGSSDTSFFTESELDTVTFIYDDAVRHAKDAYAALIEKGVAPEQARAVLPQGTYTEWVETGSLAAAARIVSLRDQDDAQKEIRDLAIMLAKEVKDIAPVSWKALTNAH